MEFSLGFLKVTLYLPLTMAFKIHHFFKLLSSKLKNEKFYFRFILDHLKYLTFKRHAHDQDHYIRTAKKIENNIKEKNREQSGKFYVQIRPELFQEFKKNLQW